MKSLHIRDIDEIVLARLHRLAKVHHRSVQGEVRAILEEAAQYASNQTDFEPLDLVTVQTGRTATWSRTEIYGDEAR
jgi:plasmid stability protein